jgi:CBS domain-containing protein
MGEAPDTVGEVMTTDVVGVGPDHTVEQAIRAMVGRDIGAVIVVEGDRPAGVFTERDLARRILDDPELLGRRVGDVMSAPVISTTPDAEMIEAFDLMNAQHVRRLAVVDGDRLVGIVTERDLLRWVGDVAAE